MRTVPVLRLFHRLVGRLPAAFGVPAAIALTVALGATVVGIAPAIADPDTTSSTTSRPTAEPPPISATTFAYLPGVEADLYLPHNRSRTVSLVVMIPGGGWQTADRSGLGQLAQALAAEGVVVSNATYRIGEEGSRFPVPAQDVSCALDASVAAVRRRGLRPDRVVLLGHSAGAHLSSLAAFGGSAFRSSGCPYPPARVDGWVGLSGIYDLSVVGSWAWPMMGATAAEDPEGYARAATRTYLATRGRPNLDALVVQGDADEILGSTSVATDFADLLREHRYRTQLTIVPGADHLATFQAEVVADTVLAWLCTVSR